MEESHGQQEYKDLSVQDQTAWKKTEKTYQSQLHLSQASWLQSIDT